MSSGQFEALIGLMIGVVAILILCQASFMIGLLLEKIIKKLNEKGWKK